MNKQKVERVKMDLEGIYIGYEKPSAKLLEKIKLCFVKLIGALLEEEK